MTLAEMAAAREADMAAATAAARGLAHYGIDVRDLRAAATGINRSAAVLEAARDPFAGRQRLDDERKAAAALRVKALHFDRLATAIDEAHAEGRLL